MGPSRRSSGQGAVAGAKAKSKRARAKIKSSKRLKLDRTGRATVRVVCTGDAGAVCRGTARLTRSGKSYGSKAFAVKAGKTATVRIKVSRAVRRTRTYTIVVSGKDSAGAKLNARQSVRLK